jgi:hypothetical protein
MIQAGQKVLEFPQVEVVSGIPDLGLPFVVDEAG